MSTQALRVGRGPSRSRVIRALARHAVIVCILLALLYPLLWMVAASFRPSAETFLSIGLLNRHWTVHNYLEGWSAGQLNFSRYFVNSLVVTSLAIAGNLVSCSLTAYAFARMTFPLKRLLFAMLLATMLLPYAVTIVPQYILFNRLGWVNTFLPLFVPKWLGVDAFFIFLMVQFIRGLPRDMDEAARIDGCGHWRIFGKIVLPLSMPALGTTALFTFVNSWNDFLGPLLYLSGPDRWTVPVALNTFLDATGPAQYGDLFAMATLSLIPIVAFFLLAQRLLLEGIATTGLK